MARGPGVWILLATLAAPSAAYAQSCRGYPAFPTGRVNFSVDGVVGADYGGAGADLNFGNRKSGPFGGVGVGAVHFVSEPKENRVSVGAVAGWERYGKDQLIICPFVAGHIEHGQEVDDGQGGRQKTSGSVLGVGMGAGFELERRGPLSYNPFLTARVARVTTKIEGDNVNVKLGETGTFFSVGVGVRINEAIQITPSMNGSTLENSNLVFDLRFSIALQLKK